MLSQRPILATALVGTFIVLLGTSLGRCAPGNRYDSAEDLIRNANLYGYEPEILKSFEVKENEDLVVLFRPVTGTNLALVDCVYSIRITRNMLGWRPDGAQSTKCLGPDTFLIRSTKIPNRLFILAGLVRSGVKTLDITWADKSQLQVPVDESGSVLYVDRDDTKEPVLLQLEGARGDIVASYILRKVGRSFAAEVKSP